MARRSPDSEDSERTREERTCVGCRRRDARTALLRFAIRTEVPRLVPDVAGRLGGRGVSVHPKRACLEQAVKAGGFARALRGSVGSTARELGQLAASQYERRLTGLLLAAHRSRALTLGTDATRDAIRAGRVRLLVVAEDAAGRREELVEQAGRLGEACVVFGRKAQLGHWLGRDEVGVLSIADEGIAEEVARAVERVNELSQEE